MSDPENGLLLSSWKEIAAYLGVSVRTAQKWETERMLPVRRPPGARGRVLVSVAELEEWMRAPEPVIEPAPVAGHQSRRWIALSLSVLALTALSGAIILWLWAPWRGNPAGWRVAGDTLVVNDDRGAELWRKTFDIPLLDYRKFADAGQEMGWVGDLDGDGRREVIFLIGPKSGGDAAVYCFSSSGEERWRFIPGAGAAAFPVEYRGPYHPGSLTVFHSNGQTRIAVASVHHTWFPAQIALLSADGRLLREYWHSGHLLTLGVANIGRRGKPLLLAGGISNARRRAVLVALDPESFGGVAHEDNPDYQLPGPPAREVARVVFARSCLNQVRYPFNGVQRLQITVDEIVAGVAEEYDHPTLVLHTFGFDGRYRSAGLSSLYSARHRELEHSKVLDHHLDEKGEEKALTQLEWLAGSSSLAGVAAARTASAGPSH